MNKLLMLQLLKFLQVHYSDGGEKLLLLAEGLLKKHIASHSLHEPEGAIFLLLPIFPHCCCCNAYNQYGRFFLTIKSN